MSRFPPNCGLVSDTTLVKIVPLSSGNVYVLVVEAEIPEASNFAFLLVSELFCIVKLVSLIVETVPAEMTNITEGELRRRLPSEVGDDVVKLLANSAEALEDFAMIKTAQDIARFNRKYGVDLTLPAEA